MKRILLGLGVLVALFNPLSGVVLMDFAISGWTWLMVEAGWIVTLVFAVFAVFYLGMLFAKMNAQDKIKQVKGNTKAKVAKKSKKDGMSYELDGVL